MLTNKLEEVEANLVTQSRAMVINHFYLLLAVGASSASGFSAGGFPSVTITLMRLSDSEICTEGRFTYERFHFLRFCLKH